MDSRVSHPVHRRLLAERLLGRCRASDARRRAAAQRSGRIDANPHQIDAVVFALRRLEEGGCILADEVGLGKTIEAGLVMSQLIAEGRSRVLLVSPKALLGQWRQELSTLFFLETREAAGSADDFAGSGVWCMGREQLGSDVTFERLRASGPFDLCVVDEAHELFAAVYRRFDRSGQYSATARAARMAGRLLELLGGHTPALLLTATPIQNSLAELWGLVRYVDPDGTLLGDLPTFRQMFCAGDDRRLLSGQERDLRDRLAVVLRRTLRRQAQEFMRTPAVRRRTRLFEYDMSEPERALYEDVTRYLMRPDLQAFQGSQRRLLLLSFHRRMASSHAALAASLERVAQRLERLLEGEDEDVASDFALDLEELEREPMTPEREPDVAVDGERVARERSEVQDFVRRLRRLPEDGKAKALVDVVRRRAAEGGKLVIFTESRVTQAYLDELLRSRTSLGPGDVTLFSGQNASLRAREALERWQSEVGRHLEKRRQPSREVAMRLALVHEFRHRSKVLISTEAGAKGLNLQFCDTLVNYDLPWNPQRVEQRIGRCHRYGQKRDVTVINFSARDNAAARHTLSILVDKLSLFDQVLDASDRVLREAGPRMSDGVSTALSREVLAEMSRIHEQSFSLAGLEQGLRELSDSLDERRTTLEHEERRMAGLIQSRFDSSVREAFRGIARRLPEELAAMDREVEQLVRDYLDDEGISYRVERFDQRVVLAIEASPRLPEGFRAGVRAVVGDARGPEALEPLHLSHPLLRAAAESARRAVGAKPLRLRLTAGFDSEVDALRGRSGRLSVSKVRYGGFEPEERLVAVASVEGRQKPLGSATTLRLLLGELHDEPRVLTSVTGAELEEAVAEEAFVDLSRSAAEEDELFENAIRRLERSVDDRVKILSRRRAEIRARIDGGRRRRGEVVGADARERVERALVDDERELEDVEAGLERLQLRRDEDYQRIRGAMYQRRYAPPARERVLEAEFVIA